MTRDTSAQVYRQIRSEGLLSRLRFQVYDVLYLNGPLTQGEVTLHFKPDMKPTISPRFAELEKRGVVEVVGKRTCKVSGRVVTLWDVTSNLPDKPNKEISNKEKIYRLKQALQLALPHLSTKLRVQINEILGGKEYK